MWPFTRKRRKDEPVKVAGATAPPTPSGLPFTFSAPDINGIVRVTPNGPTPADVLALLRGLPEHQELFFFDAYEGGGVGDSDPGSYVSVRRCGPDFAFMRGNHGWSSRWRRESIESVTSLMLRNLQEPSADDPAAYLKSMREIRLSGVHKKFDALDFA